MAEEIDIYRPLDPRRREFRLLRMLHDGISEIKCGLQIFSLDTSPEYTALSYAWTKEPPSREIEVNEKAFFVRPNLHEYLKLMHAEEHSGWIFIDAICINQNDESEIGPQVKFMGDLFRGAQEVVAWVGVQVEEMPEFVDSVISRIETFLDSGVALTAITDDKEREIVMKGTLLTFFQWSYWSRLWIAQEVILARMLTIRFRRLQLKPGFALVLLTTFLGDLDLRTKNVITNLLQMRKSSDHPIAGVCMAYFFLTDRNKFLNDPTGTASLSLSDAVTMLSNQECSKRHDKIFGLLGLTRSQLVPNYSMPILELYLRILMEGYLSFAKETALNPELQRLEVESRSLDLYNLRLCLLLGLDISIWHSVVAFVTFEFFQLIDGHRGNFSLYWTLHHSTYYFSRREIRLRPVPLRRIEHWTRTRFVQLQLRWYRAAHSKLTAPKDSGRGRTLEEWARVVEEIYNDVVTQLQANPPWEQRAPSNNAADIAVLGATGTVGQHITSQGDQA